MTTDTHFIFAGALMLALVCVGSHATDVEPEEPAPYNTESNISYYSSDIQESDEYLRERCKLDLYMPTQVRDFATVVWFHGGGLQEGNRYIPDALRNRGIAVVAVGYRLYPEVKCPAYLEDSATAVAWVFRNIAERGGDPDLIFLSGHSAGGYLTSMLGLDKRWLAAHQIDANRIAGLIPFSGHTITHYSIRHERAIPDTQPVVDEFAPLYHVRSDAPPLVLITGDREQELLGRYEENAYLMRMMKVAGHGATRLYEMPGFGHTDMMDPAFAILLRYVRETTERLHATREESP